MSQAPDSRRKGIFKNPMALLAVIVGIITALYVSSHAHADTVRFPDAQNARFSVTVTGTGPDIILIPGLASSSAVWDGTVAKLKDHYRLHVLNLSGFAGEPAGANAQGDILPAEVEAIHAYIAANHLKSPVVVGHSLGGLLSLMLAKAHPDDARKIVIADALPFVGVLFSPTATVDAVKPQAAAMRDGMQAMPADAFKGQQTAMTQRFVSSEADRARVLDWSMTSDRHVMAEAFYEDIVTDLRADLPAIKTPAVLIYPAAPGVQASMFDQMYRAAYAAKPAIDFVRIDNSLHFEMLDQPDAFNTALEAALK
ncbi:alpha/beta fold hydrolase [Asticcacaulis solisilvae]|uniref:alpha/beta fold hydrolase n=1 Tax=Asticcacaulis solisilvae TaxID=1217274 RepID=UPI003FD6DB4F